MKKIKKIDDNIIKHIRNLFRLTETDDNTIKDINNNDEELSMHSKGDNIEIVINDQADDIIEELIKSLLSRYQIGLKTSLKDKEFFFDCVYNCHKINLSRAGSCIDPPD